MFRERVIVIVCYRFCFYTPTLHQKSKALAATLNDIEPEDDSDNEDDRILNAFTATLDPTDGIVEDVVEEEELVESKFEKMDDQDDIHTAYEKLYKLSKKHEKLYRLTTKKLNDMDMVSTVLATNQISFTDDNYRQKVETTLCLCTL